MLVAIPTAVVMLITAIVVVVEEQPPFFLATHILHKEEYILHNGKLILHIRILSNSILLTAFTLVETAVEAAGVLV